MTNTFLPMVRINEKGVFKTSAASSGRSTYWLALLMVIGRTAFVRPPRIPPIHKGTNNNKAKT